MGKESNVLSEESSSVASSEKIDLSLDEETGQVEQSNLDGASGAKRNAATLPPTLNDLLDGGKVKPPDLTPSDRKEIESTAWNLTIHNPSLYHFVGSSVLACGFSISNAIQSKNQVNWTVLIPALCTYFETLFLKLNDHYSTMEDCQALLYLFETYNAKAKNGDDHQRSPGLYKGVSIKALSFFALGLIAILAQVCLALKGEALTVSLIGIIAPIVTSVGNFVLSTFYKQKFLQYEELFLNRSDAVYVSDYKMNGGISAYQPLKRNMYKFFKGKIHSQKKIDDLGKERPQAMPLRMYENANRISGELRPLEEISGQAGLK